MEWNKTNVQLIPGIYNLSDYEHHLVVNRQSRKKLLTKCKNTCEYCGGRYLKYLICARRKGKSYCCCRLCYLVTHINFGFEEEMVLCWSKMDQKEIVRNTVDFVINNNNDYFPNIKDIDPEAELVPISIFEFSNILIKCYNNKKPLPKSFKNYKIFFNEKTDTTFLDFCTSGSLFIDEDESQEEISKLSDPKVHKLTNGERKMVDELFSSQKSTMVEFDIDLENCIYKIFEDKKKSDDMELEYCTLSDDYS